MRLRYALCIVSTVASFGIFAQPALARANVDIVVGVPPPPVVVEEVPPPRPDYVWVPGYWRWNGHQHVWVAGQWVRERRGWHYVPPHWVEVGARWHFRPGHWEH